MAKRSSDVDRDRLENAIITAESNGPLKNRSSLWEAVADIYNEGREEIISPSVVYSRFKQWELTCATPLGKIGCKGPMTDEQKAKMAAARGARRSKAEVFAQAHDFDKHVESMKKTVPEILHAMLDRAVSGSRTAAMKLQCLCCVGFERSSVRDCRGHTCPLYLYRPYQKNDEEPEDLDLCGKEGGQ
jgi:hypothetical protein